MHRKWCVQDDGSTENSCVEHLERCTPKACRTWPEPCSWVAVEDSFPNSSSQTLHSLCYPCSTVPLWSSSRSKSSSFCLRHAQTTDLPWFSSARVLGCHLSEPNPSNALLLTASSPQFLSKQLLPGRPEFLEFASLTNLDSSP